MGFPAPPGAGDAADVVAPRGCAPVTTGPKPRRTAPALKSRRARSQPLKRGARRERGRAEAEARRPRRVGARPARWRTVDEARVLAGTAHPPLRGGGGGLKGERAKTTSRVLTIRTSARRRGS